MRARLFLAPGQRVHGMADGQRHQVMPGGVVVDPVDTVAEAVVGAELGRVPVGEPGPLADLGAADPLAQRHRAVVAFRLPEGTALALQRLDQRPVAQEQVTVRHLRGLVLHPVRCALYGCVALLRRVRHGPLLRLKD